MNCIKAAFVGKWRITEMDQWDQDYVDAEEPGHITLENKGLGHFHFGYVHAQLDWRYDPPIDRVEFSFLGSCEGDEMSGRGWAKIEGKQMVGQIAFHLGDESGFKARKGK
jgi:hypothetical protein